MYANIAGMEIFYERNYGDGIPVLLLHGWGGSVLSFKGVFDFLSSKGRNVINLDFPGFGKSPDPDETFGIHDYAKLIKKFIEELGIESVIVVGHSFGGRVALLLATEGELVERMVLVDSAGLKPRRKLSYYVRVFQYKLAKKTKRNLDRYGSLDYQALRQPMRSVFTRVVNQHLDDCLPQIHCPALIVWGEKDTDTPLYMAKKLKHKIRDSGLIVFENCGHYSYLEKHGQFCIILDEFIRSK